jgi:outer membrane protein assembly factor BamB
VSAASVNRPWGSVSGITMFRGNPTRTFYGSGPVPATTPTIRWRFPEEPMCGQSPVGSQNKVWCGSGWTGQPVVWDRPDGTTEVIFGAYDKQIHFLDADTGEQTRPDFDMGDIIKGSVTLDPDGFPLLYAGSRDPRFRIIGLDGDEPHELWSLHARSVEGIWNDDWDSNAVVVDDVLYVGGENSWWFAIKLNRGYDDEGMVTVDPEVVYQMPAWNEELRELIGRQQSVENSTAVFGRRAFFANSAGRVVGVDITSIAEGEADVVFDFWMGDDTDATITIDDEGFLYVAAQTDLSLKNNTAARRVRDVGQVVKLDPDRPEDPIVWSLEVPAARGQKAGVWATPALVGDVLFVAGNPGDLLAIDRNTGDVIWSDFVGGNAWSSPVVADGTLVIAVDCLTQEAGLRAYDVSDPSAPERIWDLPLGAGCLESTPAIWGGNIYVGSRDGFFYAIGAAA